MAYSTMVEVVIEAEIVSGLMPHTMLKEVGA